MMPEYVTELMARDRLAELRALAARQNLLREVRPLHRSLRVVLGMALVRMGQRLIRPEGSGVAERRSPA